MKSQTIESPLGPTLKLFLVSDSKEDVFAAYESSAYNCYITAGIYAAVVAFSGWQVMVNSKLSEYEN